MWLQEATTSQGRSPQGSLRDSLQGTRILLVNLKTQYPRFGGLEVNGYKDDRKHSGPVLLFLNCVPVEIMTRLLNPEHRPVDICPASPLPWTLRPDN